MPGFVDSHAHLTDGRFAGEVGPVLERARQAGIEHVVTIGSDLADSEAAVALARLHPDVSAAVGIHPHAAESATPGALSAIVELAATPEVRAIGETGLDYHYDNAPRSVQRAVFSRHLELGAELGLPVVVHAREADDDVRAALREAGAAVKGVLHSFAGGRPLLEVGLELGWYVSFSGMITFARYEDADLVRAVPLDRLLIETDSPYLAPAPHRGRRNEPAYVAVVAARAATLRDLTVEELAAATSRNARSFFALGV